MRYVFLTLLLGSDAWACSCIPSFGCSVVASNEAKSAPTFVGTVLKVGNGPSQEAFLDRVKVRLRIDERLAGVPSDIHEMEIFTGQGGGDCGVSFAQGERYLIFGSRGQDGRVHTGLCSGTRPLSESAPALRTLRQSRDGQPLPALTGQLRQASNQGEAFPIPHTVVLVRIGAQSFRTVTDSEGVYSFAELPEGAFTLATEASSEARANHGTIAPKSCLRRDVYLPAPKP